jgi:Bacteriocin-protection, YdeI or OmpD-Associated
MLREVRENCPMSPVGRAMRYTTTLEPLSGTKARVPVPFDPDAVWGTKRQHHVGGTIAGVRVRGSIRRDHSGWSFSVSLCDRAIAAGDVVSVVISPEGPQRWDLEPDLQAALEASPDAGAFFDSLAQFYRKGYVRWIDATKRRPDVRAERIAEVVRLLNAGVKERPRP